MAIKGCKSIAEYAFRKWMIEQGFVDGYFTLETYGNNGVITDKAGNTLDLFYDSQRKCVCDRKQEENCDKSIY